MFKTYLRRHSDGRMESVTRGLDRSGALAQYALLVGRDDLAGEPWAAILRNDLARRTVLFSRFDAPDQRLLIGDAVGSVDLFDPECNADENVRRIVHARRQRPPSATEIITQMLDEFERDPADTEFQRGYRAAIADLRQRLIAERN